MSTTIEATARAIARSDTNVGRHIIHPASYSICFKCGNIIDMDSMEWGVITVCAMVFDSKSIWCHKGYTQSKKEKKRPLDSLHSIVYCFPMAFSSRFCVCFISLFHWMLMNNFNGHLTIHLHTNVCDHFIVFFFIRFATFFFPLFSTKSVAYLVLCLNARFIISWQVSFYSSVAVPCCEPKCQNATTTNNKSYFYGKKSLIRNEMISIKMFYYLLRFNCVLIGERARSQDRVKRMRDKKCHTHAKNTQHTIFRCCGDHFKKWTKKKMNSLRVSEIEVATCGKTKPHKMRLWSQK